MTKVYQADIFHQPCLRHGKAEMQLSKAPLHSFITGIMRNNSRVIVQPNAKTKQIKRYQDEAQCMLASNLSASTFNWTEVFVLLQKSPLLSANDSSPGELVCCWSLHLCWQSKTAENTDKGDVLQVWQAHTKTALSSSVYILLLTMCTRQTCKW